MKAVMAAAKEFGYYEFVAVQTVFYMQELRKNRFGEPNNVVKELTGRDAEDFESIVRQFFADSP
jgi:NAD(P)H dehydrogenase (quinone)